MDEWLWVAWKNFFKRFYVFILYYYNVFLAVSKIFGSIFCETSCHYISKIYVKCERIFIVIIDIIIHGMKY